MSPLPNAPLVSIVTPSYNQARYLEAAIESVLSQDYPNLEYVVIDGGSTDGTLEILESYGSRLDRWVSEADEGQAEAINKGFRMSSGDILAWLNSDDLYLPGAVASAVRAFEREPQAGLVYGDGIMVDEELRLLDYHRYPQVDGLDLLRFEVILQPAVFMRAGALYQAGLLDPQYELVLDHDLWLRIAARAPLVHVPEYWALERTHPAAKTRRAAAQFVVEAETLVSRASEEESLRHVVKRNRSKIDAALSMFAARRLIDASEGRAALIRVLEAWRVEPREVLRYWYKVPQAVLAVIGLEWLYILYRRLRRWLVHRGRKVVVSDADWWVR